MRAILSAIVIEGMDLRPLTTVRALQTSKVRRIIEAAATIKLAKMSLMPSVRVCATCEVLVGAC